VYLIFCCLHACLPPPLRAQAAEALRRAKFKFPGRQKVVASRNWGFTPYSRDDYLQWKREGRLVNCGVHAQVGDNGIMACGLGMNRGGAGSGGYGRQKAKQRQHGRPTAKTTAAAGRQGMLVPGLQQAAHETLVALPGMHST
jgi:hypothetical protein